MPIVDHCLRNPLRDVVKAILVYPMNALANDQRDPIRRPLAGSEVTFGVYTGETKQLGQGRPENVPENERITRANFARTRLTCCSRITGCSNTSSCGAMAARSFATMRSAL